MKQTIRPGRSFRFRLATAFVLTATIVTVVFGVSVYLVVRRDVRADLAARAERDARFVIESVAPARLDGPATRKEIQESEIVADLERTADGWAIETADGSQLSSGFVFAAEPSAELQSIIDAERLGIEWVTTAAGDPYVVAAGRAAPGQPTLLLYYSAREAESTLATLRRALVIGGIVVVGLAAIGASVIARRVLRPVALAADAAQQLAGGDLAVRLPADRSDEFGVMLQSFNTMAQSLSDKIAALEHAESEQRRFVADVSHELKTPLTALVTESELLAAHSAEMPADARRMTELLHIDVGRLRSLVEDLLEISRLDAGAVDSHVSTFDVGSSVVQLAAVIVPAAEVVTPDEPAVVTTDMRRLERVLTNLLENAKRHAPGAPVTVTVTVREDAVVAVDVIDRGPGVPEAMRAAIFERFAKADSSRAGEGTGLGLAIARAHARQMGGDLTAQPTPGGGLTFRLTLPRSSVTQLLPDGDAGATGEPHGEPPRSREDSVPPSSREGTA